MCHLSDEYDIIQDGMSVKITCYNIGFSSQSILPRLVPQHTIAKSHQAETGLFKTKRAVTKSAKPLRCQGKIQSSSNNFNRE